MERAVRYPLEISQICLMRLSRFSYSKLYKLGGDTADRKKTFLESSGNMFFLFDYFDRLCFSTSGDLMQYEDCFGIEQDISHFHAEREQLKHISINHEPNCIASQLWTIVKAGYGDFPDTTQAPANMATRAANSDPFNFQDDKVGQDGKVKESDTLSSKPFFALVNITINPESYQFWLKANNFDTYGQAKFLEDCRFEIDRRIESALSRRGKASSTIYSVYMSMNYGDLCIAVRTADLLDVYAISAEIGRKQPDNAIQNSIFKFSTLTTIGLETKTKRTVGKRNKKTVVPLAMGAETLQLNNKNLCVVIRMTASNTIIQELTDNKPGAITENSGDTYIPMGIFGKYDVSVRLSLSDFNDLYPLLCKYKLNLGNVQPADFEITQPSKIVEIIKRGIIREEIHVINERVMLSISPQHSQVEKDNDEKCPDLAMADVYESFLNNSALLLNKINELADKAYMLPMQRRVFSENMRLVKDLYNTYRPMWVQQDSRLNVWLFFAIMKALTKSIEVSLDKIAAVPKDKYRSQQLYGMCTNLLEAISISVRTIHSFMKIMQSTNLQTVDSPSYEIQTSVDVEKYSIAFTQYLLDYTSKFFSFSKKSMVKNGINRILPIISMDSSVQAVAALPLFTYSPIQMPSIGPVNEPTLFTVILIPTFECFVKAFDLLPLISHELNHSFRFISRELRNKHMIRLIFDRVSQYAANQWISMSSPKRNYTNITALQKLPAEAIYKALMDVYPFAYSRFSLSCLKDDLIAFLQRDVFVDSNEFTIRNPLKTTRQTFVDSFEYMHKCIYEYGQFSSTSAEDYAAALRNFSDIRKLLDDNAVIDIPQPLYKKLWEMLSDYRKNKKRIPGAQLENPDKDSEKAEHRVPLNQLEHVLQFVSYRPEYESFLRELSEPLASIGIHIENHTFCIPSGIIGAASERFFGLVIGCIMNQLRLFWEQDLFCPRKFIQDLSFSFDTKKTETFTKDIQEMGNIFNQFFHMLNDDESIFITEDDRKKRYFERYDYERNYDVVLSKNYMAFEKKLKVYDKYLPGGQFDVYQYLPHDRAGCVLSSIAATKQIARECLQAIAGSIFHFNCIRNVAGEPGNQIPICSGYAKSVLFDEIRNNLRDRLESLTDREITAPEFYPFISALCATEEESINFIATVSQCFASIGGGRIDEMVKGPIELYREVVADLGMCAAIGFEPLGYLKFFTRYYHRSHCLVTDKSYDMTAERAAQVLCVLLRRNAEANSTPAQEKNKLFESLSEYIGNVFNETRKQMQGIFNTIRENKSSWDEAWIEIDKFLVEQQPLYQKCLEDIRNGLPVSGGCLLNQNIDDKMNELAASDRPFGKRNPKRQVSEYFERISRLYYMLHLLERVFQMMTDIGEDTKTHLYGLYVNHIIHKQYNHTVDSKYSLCAWEDENDLSKTRSSIGEYHNSTNPYEPQGKDDGSSISNQILRETFSFILSQFYRNRLLLSKEPDFDEKWVDRLMGG